LIGEPEGKIPLAIHWSRWEDNIKMSLKNNGQEEVDWIYLAEHREQWWALFNTATGNKKYVILKTCCFE
jgi:dTDP-D-glucose 4,6-dehydratase